MARKRARGTGGTPQTKAQRLSVGIPGAAGRGRQSRRSRGKGRGMTKNRATGIIQSAPTRFTRRVKVREERYYGGYDEQIVERQLGREELESRIDQFLQHVKKEGVPLHQAAYAGIAAETLRNRTGHEVTTMQILAWARDPAKNPVKVKAEAVE